MAEKKRPATAGDMIRSMLVVLAPVALLMALLTQTPDQPNVPTVDWRPTLTKARAESPWPVLAPNGLPEGPKQWRASRAHWSKAGEAGPLGGGPSTRNQWLLGLLSPDPIHYMLQQADGDQDSFVREVTHEAKRVGESTVSGATWEKYESADGRTRSMVRRAPNNVAIVTADTDFGHLDQFVRTLAER